MSNEDFVSHTIMRFLQTHRWQIAQYHPPGGQANFKIQVDQVIAYPDIIAFNSYMILVFENKGKFDSADLEKLRGIYSTGMAKKQIEEYVQAVNAKRKGLEIKGLKLLLTHGYGGEMIDLKLDDINLVHVDEMGQVTVQSSVENPLVL